MWWVSVGVMCVRWVPKNVEFTLFFFQRGLVLNRISKDESSEEEEQHGQPYQQFVPHQTQFLDNSSQFSQPKKKKEIPQNIKEIVVVHFVKSFRQQHSVQPNINTSSCSKFRNISAH